MRIAELPVNKGLQMHLRQDHAKSKTRLKVVDCAKLRARRHIANSFLIRQRYFYQSDRLIAISGMLPFPAAPPCRGMSFQPHTRLRSR